MAPLATKTPSHSVSSNICFASFCHSEEAKPTKNLDSDIYLLLDKAPYGFCLKEAKPFIFGNIARRPSPKKSSLIQSFLEKLFSK